MRLNQHPFRICQIACLALPSRSYFCRVISVHMMCLDDCYTTTIMPQPTEITQFIFGQPLSVLHEIAAHEGVSQPRSDSQSFVNGTHVIPTAN